MRHFLFTLASCAALLGGPAVAQDNPVVVELFTSQGCSSCPPADALLHDLAKREDVIALALHVDYSDYIGWKDPFGDAAHAERQRSYARAGQRRHIYTPEMIVNGTTDIVGAKSMKLAEAILDHARQPKQVALGLKREGDKLSLTASPLSQLRGPLTVHLLRYTPKESTRISRGENAGKTLTYANIVEGWTVLGEWDGAGPLEMSAQVSGDLPTVVIIQQDGTGPIVGAARLR